MKKRVRIVVEQRRRWVAGGNRVDGPCPTCRCDVETLTRQEAAVFLEVGLADVDALAANGRIHAIFTVAGSFRVCKRSLLRSPDQG